MRLLYVINSLAPGGAEMSLAEMAPELIRQGIELHVLPLGKRLDLRDRLLDAGAHVHQGPRARNRVGAVREVASVIAVVDPDLVHTTLFEADVVGRLAARLRSVPSSTSVVGDTYGPRTVARNNWLKVHAAKRTDQVTARLAQRFHAVSQHLAIAATRHLKVPSSRIEVIPRGRSAKHFPFRPETVRAQVRRELNMDDHVRIVLAVGRLEPVKGLDQLIEALPELAASVPDVRVLVAGKDGAASNDLRSAASLSGVPVRFLGHRTDVNRLLAASDALAFPSLSEGSPGTLIEAMATGCPIVASEIPPNLEVLGIEEQLVGLTVPVQDPPALAQSLAKALTDKRRMASMTSDARRRFEARYEVTAIAVQMKNFFQKTASNE